jgi:hypothetical protein
MFFDHFIQQQNVYSSQDHMSHLQREIKFQKVKQTLTNLKDQKSYKVYPQIIRIKLGIPNRKITRKINIER